MELYGYTSYHYPPRSPSTGPRMHSTLAFPGSSGRRGSLPVINSGVDIHASPSSLTSPRVAHAPLVPNGREPKTPTMANGRSGGVDMSPKRQRVAERPRAVQRVDGPDARGMEEEVKRLLASCEAQEAKIKRTKASIEDRLFPELDNTISSLSDIDREADEVIAQLDDSLAAARPILAARISKLIATHQAKVDEMEASSTPWRDLLNQSKPNGDEEHPESDGSASANGDEVSDSVARRKIEEGDEAALARIEGWAREVKNYLTSEIALLHAEAAAKKRGPVWYAFWIFVSAVAAALLAIFIVYLRGSSGSEGLGTET